MSASQDMKEGFLCPICMADLGDVIQLQVHFEEKHDKEDPAFVQNLKDLFGKAKRKILNEEGGASGGNAGSGNASFSSLNQSFSQDLLNLETAKQTIFGASAADEAEFDPVSGVHSHLMGEGPSKLAATDHTDFFRVARKQRLDQNKRTNQTMIRLERLMRNMPSDPLKRRAHEQAVVTWHPEEVVQLCTCCGKGFNIVRRKHHCRLCGGVICNDCSDHIAFDLAKKLVAPYVVSPDEESAPNASAKSSGLFGSKRLSGSSEGLNTIKGLMTGDLKAAEHSNQLRICKHCKEILDEQEKKLALEEDSDEAPLLTQYYDSLQVHMREAGVLMARYSTMVDSLQRGEEEFRPEDAKVVRVRLTNLAENLKTLALRIRQLDATQPLQLKLQSMVCNATVEFIKEELLVLPSAPTDEEFQRLKAKRVRDAERKVAEEKEAARLAKAKFEEHKAQQEALKKLSLPVAGVVGAGRKGGNAPSPQNKKNVTLGSGFVLSSTLSSSDFNTSSDDPMVQQIANIRGFIAEAKRLGRYDEVAALEDNLRELQEEYKKGQAEKRELEENYNDFKGMFHKTSPAKQQQQQPQQPTSPAPYVYEEGESVAAAAAGGLGSPDAVDIDEYDASGKNPFFDE